MSTVFVIAACLFVAAVVVVLVVRNVELRERNERLEASLHAVLRREAGRER